MNLKIKMAGNFEIINGKITSDVKFKVKKEDNDLIIFNEGITFNGVSIDGITIKSGSIKINNNEIIINGLKINNSMINKENEVLKEDEYLEYPFEEINSISINSSAKVKIMNFDNFNLENFNFNVSGSGKIVTNEDKYHFLDNMNLNVQGSGKIKIYTFQSLICNAMVQGSGKNELNNSNFDTINGFKI